ncbi:cytochrome c biogenesis protein ResB [Geobacter sulfurreducens]|uniref:ResB-like family cytochrome c biogenesis protein n=1 Tax=Geobacter sulfurreducens (strain ATCC 51573 / DSM 12127 / PCA) TaxID=243231 RepID=Q74FJ5_GEOSL|nr:cytochrome c biogenesis protein ResB [Geobacter sulfurreducens]AAR33944.1 ResB-like family cytochrome c biogenesis protein [Geobacter sulfurreducens PCA]AJY70366.1 cytochrome C biogenesis protein ResB [Geobacter sulfurreducens]QVW35859.1 cytochrome c biogenesis protein ResB [Geobacter sulfurreducens]UAC04683.1 cytochrome c biogenesis protein ResB [Geobacter sulfurreducens]UTG93315.1 cytochrome c biogenesis protein ResB [Geobacter sulfurreducens]
MTTSDRGFLQALWDFFCSLKLAIFLLILLAATSIIGTIIPQQNPLPPEYIAAIGGTGSMKFKVYSTLGFFDMYHSWWFILLLYLFTVNIVACSIKRLPRVWKTISEPTLVMDEGFERTLTLTHDFKKEGDAADLNEKMKAFLKSEFAEPVVTERDGEFHLFAQKSPYSRLGVYVVHLSIVIIFIGALLGSFFGYKAYVNIVEGSGASTVMSRKGVPIDLGFTVKCEDFSVSFYDTGAPKEFKSLLTVIDGGKVVIDKRPVIVNEPLTYKGITFYQSSYGPADEGGLYHLTVRERKGGAPVRLSLSMGERKVLPDGSAVQLLEATDEIGRFIPQFRGPAVRVAVEPKSGEPQAFIVFQNYPEFDVQRGADHIFTYEGADLKMFTGLQVAKDPGVWVVWLGCTLMVVGCCMAFFMSHKRIWIRVRKGHVTLGGTANKNQPGFQLAFDTLVDKLKTL